MTNSTTILPNRGRCANNSLTMSRTHFICLSILFMSFMTVCESMPANFRSSRLTQHRRSLNNDQNGYPAQVQQHHNGQRTEGINQPYSMSDDVPFGRDNPLPYSPEIQERILEGLNGMIGDITAEVVSTLEMLEMKKKMQKKQERNRRSSHVSPSEDYQKLADEKSNDRE
ncbi:hypothetical protein Ocin01_14317 [Orchesella cincta]|uniref:Uncharacterized protein n=1 Tax=Orchesella cincta TaxID=48709 RepID=A0A1D2MH91_ORCCI|nr:hypothetical protein Ocin01_14317 [Orchesella cincta]